MKQSDVEMCRYSISDLLNSVLAMFEMITYLPFNEHFELVENLVITQEIKCDEMIKRVEELYKDEDGSDKYEMERTMVVSMVKILKAQVAEQLRDTERPINVKINKRGFYEMISSMMR